jgi:hypothetical protein
MKRGRKPNPELAPKIAAIHRLNEDGATTNAAIRRRIALIAAERKLDASETKALMEGRWLTTYHLCQLAKKHHLSVSWLIHGDLKGLLDTVRGLSLPARTPTACVLGRRATRRWGSGMKRRRRSIRKRNRQRLVSHARRLRR